MDRQKLNLRYVWSLNGHRHRNGLQVRHLAKERLRQGQHKQYSDLRQLWHPVEEVGLLHRVTLNLGNRCIILIPFSSIYGLPVCSYIFIRICIIKPPPYLFIRIIFWKERWVLTSSARFSPSSWSQTSIGVRRPAACRWTTPVEGGTCSDCAMTRSTEGRRSWRKSSSFSTQLRRNTIHTLRRYGECMRMIVLSPDCFFTFAVYSQTTILFKATLIRSPKLGS